VRTRGNPLLILPAVRRELRALDPGIALATVATMDDARARSMAGDRLVAILLGAFAALALSLAAVGIFGVLSYAMEQRTRELAIRVALGARAADVLSLVARETVPMVGAGLAAGLLVSAALTRFARSMLYEIQPDDPTTFLSVATILATIAIVAAYLPARRAARVDPVSALRNG
jgi:ABC-type antimicrobial peptide transport system permease subunit